MNHMLFEEILNQIHNQNIKKFVIECLKKAPDELNTIPASTSGKYHPEECCKEGGLVAHIKRACFFATILLDSHKINCQDIKGDVLLASVLLHDIGKKGEYGKNYSEYVNHPLVAATMIEEFKSLIPPNIFKTIQNCVKFHMGPFSNSVWGKNINDYTMLELMTYYSDYLASKKCFTILK